MVGGGGEATLRNVNKTVNGGLQEGESVEQVEFRWAHRASRRMGVEERKEIGRLKT